MEFAEQREESVHLGNGARYGLLSCYPAFASLLAARSVNLPRAFRVNVIALSVLLGAGDAVFNVR